VADVDQPNDSVLTRVLSSGVDWFGREYTRQLRRSLGLDYGRRDDWVSEVGFDGDGVPDDVYFDVILAAIDEASDDETLLWCIADGPVDHLVGRDWERWGPRFHSERSAPSVDLMFRVMQESLRSEGHDCGWWDDHCFGPRQTRKFTSKLERQRAHRRHR